MTYFLKSGLKTTEFWLTVAANVLVQAGALDVPSKWKWLVSLATITGYSLSRGLAKNGTPDVDHHLPTTSDVVDIEPDANDQTYADPTLAPPKGA